MREVEYVGRFKRDWKKVVRGSRDADGVLRAVLDLLCNDKPLPIKNKDHALSGDYIGWRECHLKPDLLLIYRKHANKISLARIGSHSELF